MDDLIDVVSGVAYFYCCVTDIQGLSGYDGYFSHLLDILLAFDLVLFLPFRLLLLFRVGGEEVIGFSDVLGDISFF